MKICTKITLWDHFRDCIRRSYSSFLGLGLPAVALAFNLLNAEYRSSIMAEGAVVGAVVAFLIFWAVVNVTGITLFMLMSMFGPVGNLRGNYEISL